MCFVVYAGTERPLSRKPWDSKAPDISVSDLSERDRPLTAHFSKPEVQYIGSTSGCGCDFPHVTFQNGEWPWFAEFEVESQRESERYNQRALASLLRSSGEESVELYGVWDGDFATPPKAREESSLEALIAPDFRFKELGLYVVRLVMPS